VSVADLAWAAGVLEPACCFSIVRAPNGRAWVAPRYQLHAGHGLPRALFRVLGCGRASARAYSVTGGNLAAVARRALPLVRSRRGLFVALAAWPQAPAGRPPLEHTHARNRAAIRIIKELST
jgi:hypothetical protein